MVDLSTVQGVPNLKHFEAVRFSKLLWNRSWAGWEARDFYIERQPARMTVPSKAMTGHGLRCLSNPLSIMSSSGETREVIPVNYRSSRRQGRPGTLFPSKMRSADMPDPKFRARVLENIIGQCLEMCGLNY